MDFKRKTKLKVMVITTSSKMKENFSRWITSTVIIVYLSDMIPHFQFN